MAQNSALYFLSLGLPAITALFLVPLTVRSLGPARFGLLALAWAVAEGSGMFDFGLGRATVRFVADATEKGKERLREIVLASVFFQTGAGAAAGVLLFLLAPLLVSRVFTVSPSVISEATAMFKVLAFHLPVLLAAAALRAALEGAQRFDISASLRMPGSMSAVAIPAIVSHWGYSLVLIMWALLAVRVVLVLISAMAVKRTLGLGRWGFPSSSAMLKEMFRYSGWVAISTAVGPLLGSLERFIVGSVVGVAGLGFYTGAAEAANRFLLIPVTAFSALLPALAATDATGARSRALSLTRAARRQLAALLFPLCLTLLAFAPAILRLWLGPVFSDTAGTALRILSVGVFFGGLAHLPLALLYGSNRPDIPAKIHVVEVILYMPFAFFLVKTWGISGAAAAWSTRCAADLALYEATSRRVFGRCGFDGDERSRTLELSWTGLSLAAVFGTAFWLRHMSPMAGLAVAAFGLIIYAALGWRRVLSPTERSAWTTTLLRVRAPQS
ncbi:MAG: oligosaccharide flippase family protein [Gemmatimonadales bacterium]